MWSQNITSEYHNLITAFDIGIRVPEIKVIKTPEDRKNMANSSEWELKKQVALKKIKGIPISEFVFYNGEMKYNTIAIMSNKLLSGDMGPGLEANIITLFPGSIKVLKKPLEKLRGIVKAREPSFKGFLGLSATLNDQIYYNKIWAGSTFDFAYAFAELYNVEPEKLKDVLYDKEELKPYKYSASMRIWVYPYNKDANFNIDCYDGHTGDESWILTAHGESVKKTWLKLFDKAKQYNCCYRDDGSVIARRIIKNLGKEGYI